MNKPKQPRTRHRRHKAPPKTSEHSAAGLRSRSLALDLLHKVLKQRSGLDEALLAAHDDSGLDARDRGFSRLLATTVLRRHGQLRAVVDEHLAKRLPAGGYRADLNLLLGAAQLLFLDVPAHAVIDTAVSLSRQRKSSARFDKLTNAVLRRVAESGAETVERQDAVSLNVPHWLLDGWRQAYGEDSGRAIAAASLREATLDITLKCGSADNLDHWARELQATPLATGSLRRLNDGRVDKLPGFDDGAWWVQDAAAALPAGLLGDVRGLVVADLCAAPGGKTAQLAAAGARVTAVDSSRDRLARVRDNLNRLRLDAEIVAEDAAAWSPPTAFDAVLVDAPCTATGTIRRHPDILHLKRAEDIEKMASIQSAILDNAVRMVKPGGHIVYCTCSLERREGEEQIERLLRRSSDFERVALRPGDVRGQSAFITPAGDLRTFPNQLAHDDPALSGLDGFYACKLKRLA